MKKSELKQLIKEVLSEIERDNKEFNDLSEEEKKEFISVVIDHLKKIYGSWNSENRRYNESTWTQKIDFPYEEPFKNSNINLTINNFKNFFNWARTPEGKQIARKIIKQAYPTSNVNDQKRIFLDYYHRDYGEFSKDWEETWIRGNFLFNKKI